MFKNGHENTSKRGRRFIGSNSSKHRLRETRAMLKLTLARYLRVCGRILNEVSDVWQYWQQLETFIITEIGWDILDAFIITAKSVFSELALDTNGSSRGMTENQQRLPEIQQEQRRVNKNKDREPKLWYHLRNQGADEGLYIKKKRA